jgi:hypothetical protein
MKTFKITTSKEIKFICANDINEAAHEGANLEGCCFSDFDWNTKNDEHWFTTQYGDVDVLEVNISIQDLFDKYASRDIIQQLLDKKSKDEYSDLEFQKLRSKQPKAFEEGAKWAISELTKRVEKSEKYTWGDIKQIILSMGFKL